MCSVLLIFGKTYNNVYVKICAYLFLLMKMTFVMPCILNVIFVLFL